MKLARLLRRLWWHRCWRCKTRADGLRWRGGAAIGCCSWEHPFGDCEYVA